MKVCMTVAVIIGLTFLQLTRFEGISYLLLLCCFCFGIAGLAIYPVGLEMASECTFPVTELTSSGLIVLTGQVTSVLFVAIISGLSDELTPEKRKAQVCSKEEPQTARDYFWGLIVGSFHVLRIPCF